MRRILFAPASHLLAPASGDACVAICVCCCLPIHALMRFTPSLPACLPYPIVVLSQLGLKPGASSDPAGTQPGAAVPPV